MHGMTSKRIEDFASVIDGARLYASPAPRPAFKRVALGRDSDGAGISQGGLIDALRRTNVTNTAPNRAHGTALVHFTEAMVAWHRWSNAAPGLDQRLSVNCALKDAVWATACALPAAMRLMSPVVEVDVVLHWCHGDPHDAYVVGAEPDDTASPWIGIWVIDGWGECWTADHGRATSCRVVAGACIVIDGGPVRIEWHVDAETAGRPGQPAIFAELRVHRLVRGAWPASSRACGQHEVALS
jgi:hypothetical protein